MSKRRNQRIGGKRAWGHIQKSLCEFKRFKPFVNVEANSGVFIRCQDPGLIAADNCYEVNIFDTRPDQTYRSGGIVNFAAPETIIYTGGRWNAYEIVADGSNLRVTLNGSRTVDIEDETYTTGPIALQYGSGTIMFRNVRVREL